ncbi:MAG: thioredoxin [Oscillatoria sp. SIO1A7]|nr:thioredoxin [Oscillatoria sp. SIO1A7]
MSITIVVTDDELSTEVEKAQTPLLLYFWATWCGPCKLVSPSVEWVANNYSDRLKVIKMQVDNREEFKAIDQYKVQGVPALRVIENQEVLTSHEGAITKNLLVEMIEQHI